MGSVVSKQLEANAFNSRALAVIAVNKCSQKQYIVAIRKMMFTSESLHLM